MASKAKLLGHPVHPMLIPIPLGLLGTAAVFDLIYLAGRTEELATTSFFMIAAGILGGLLAAVFGLVDWLAIPRGTRAKRIGMLHGLGNVAVVALFAASWLLRLGQPDYAPQAPAIVLSVGAALLALVSGWLGGELVNRLGVGVDEGANLNAPSSLSGKPARQV